MELADDRRFCPQGSTQDRPGMIQEKDICSLLDILAGSKTNYTPERREMTVAVGSIVNEVIHCFCTG